MFDGCGISLFIGGMVCYKAETLECSWLVLVAGLLGILCFGVWFCSICLVLGVVLFCLLFVFVDLMLRSAVFVWFVGGGFWWNIVRCGVLFIVFDVGGLVVDYVSSCSCLEASNLVLVYAFLLVIFGFGDLRVFYGFRASGFCLILSWVLRLSGDVGFVVFIA